MLDSKDVVKSLLWRCAVKSFSQEKLPNDIIDSIKEILVLTPSAYGIQPWRFIIVQNEEIRKQLTSHSWNQPQIENCSHFIVFCAMKTINEKYINEYIELMAEKRGTKIADLVWYKDMLVKNLLNLSDHEFLEWSKRQAYIALGNLLTSLAVMQIDSCPIEGLSASDYDKILGLENTNYATVFACPIGFRDQNDPYAKLTKVRFDIEDVFEYR